MQNIKISILAAIKTGEAIEETYSLQTASEYEAAWEMCLQIRKENEMPGTVTFSPNGDGFTFEFGRSKIAVTLENEESAALIWLKEQMNKKADAKIYKNLIIGKEYIACRMVDAPAVKLPLAFAEMNSRVNDYIESSFSEYILIWYNTSKGGYEICARGVVFPGVLPKEAIVLWAEKNGLIG